MANLLWGNVYYQDQFAGVLSEEPGNRASFTYDPSYLSSAFPPIAFTLPKQIDAHISQLGLHPFFDNLVAEGWLEHAQTRILGKRIMSRLELLLAFGGDCAGAVSVRDPDPARYSGLMLDIEDPKERALFASQASLSGVQPKLALIKQGNKMVPAKINQLSTHIAKFPSRGHDNLVVNEYLTTLAFKALLPNDQCVELSIGEVKGINEQALIIKRFDRSNQERLHFEELNQLLGYPSKAKYNGSYKEMANWIHQVQEGQVTELYRLYTRRLAGILLGNTDMHLKNFAMAYTNEGIELSPSYDQVSAVIYDYKTMALTIAGASNYPITDLKQKHILTLGTEFKLSKNVVMMAVTQLGQNLSNAKDAIAQSKLGTTTLKNILITQLEKRWNGTFALIGNH